ncbi:hypothetical protein OG345_42085 (plasmid) [Streptomyces sp. NBC_01220]|uniref:hypothetical protein n=1 Tax=Streptomyces sp. NBC_01220 TaxID=2903781 RepID=UPI00352DE3DE|nr:hypothetical protein OG345_42085 [Streptomyces sp. NBC_01220]
MTTATAPAATAPLFAALAAHQAADEAALSLRPLDLYALGRHLHTIGAIDALSATEDGRYALTSARNLRDRAAANLLVRASIDTARAAILAMAPHAARMHGTDLPATADDIRAAALAYNAVDGSHEELTEIQAGTPSIRVHCRSDSGTGWTVTAVITAGVDTRFGHIPAHPAIIVKFRKTDGRRDAAENARRIFGARFRVDVPVTYVANRRV